MSRGRRARIVLLLALGGAAWSCARQGAPPGGPDDRRPPVVVSVEPDTFATVEAGLDRLRVRFNERISEQATSGTLESAVEISPEVPEVRVEHDRRGLDIHIPGGLRPGLAYRVRITPAIRDMFGNPMAVPFEWVFSTGGDFTQNAVVGQVWDRSTGDFLEGVRIALGGDGDGADSMVYASRSGTEGLFALRSVPEGSFDVTALLDRNGNREADGSEAIGRGRVEELGPADTVFLSLSVLVPDTTPAQLGRVEALDSVTLRLTFDDFVDPTSTLEGARASLDPLPADSAGELPPQPDGPLPAPRRLFHAGEWEIYEDSLQSVADSLARLAADSAAAAADSAGVAVDSAEVAVDSAQLAAVPPEGPPVAVTGPPDRLDGGIPGRGAGGEPRTLPDGTPVPDPSIVILFDGPLPPGIEIGVSISGIRNLNGLEDGGGDATVTWTPPAPDSIQGDTLAVDSIGPSADTLGLPPDTLAPRTLAPDVQRTPLQPFRLDAPIR